MTKETRNSPQIFISYCQQPPAVKAWVEKLAGKLRKKGYGVRVDTESKRGSSIPEWCRERAGQAEAVLLICTPEYKAKILSKKGYLWDEAQVIEARWSRRGQNHGVIPLLRSGDAGDSVPDFCGSRGTEHLDFRRDDHFEADLAALEKALSEAVGAHRNEPVDAPGEFAVSETGIILMADVLDFTMRLGAEQERIMQRMIEFSESALPETSRDSRIILHLLDGIAIIWKNSNAFAEACRTARALIKHMETGRPEAVIRTGLHIGPFSVCKHKPVYFGSALNDCRRICQIGDHKHVVMSESFCVGWLNREHHELQEQIFPRTNDKPIQVYPWRRKDGSIRLLKEGEGDDRVPAELAVREIASKFLSQLIEHIGRSVSQIVKNTFHVSEAKQGLRVALWAPNPEQQDELTATEFRWPEKKLTGQPPSLTTYQILNEGEPPAGRAFCLADVVVIHKLPNPHPASNPGKAWEKYSEIMLSQGIRPQTLEKFSRHARAFLCFAFPILHEAHEDPAHNGGGIRQPFGVICMDFLDPLSKATEDELRGIAREIRDVFQTELTLAWRDRT